MKVFLHVCYCDLHQLTENDFILWSDLYYHHRKMIENNTVDLFGPPVDNLEIDLNDDESDSEYGKLEDKEQM
jgi:hypothetical protein